jgi:DNA-binding NarL/FixJ family response regulator
MSPARVVLVGGSDMLQEVMRQAVDDDPELELVGELATAEGLPGLWQRLEVDVVIIRPLTADVPAAVLPEAQDARIPAVVGVDQAGTRGLILLHDISRHGLIAAIRAAAELSRTQGDRLIMGWAHRARNGTQQGLDTGQRGASDRGISCRYWLSAMFRASCLKVVLC